MSVNSVVKIGPKRGEKPRAQPYIVVEKFFLAGVAAGLLGSLVLGLYLWLVVRGELSPSQNLLLLRNTHALIQIYLFLGLFILGFCFHALPRIMGGGVDTPRFSYLCLALALAGCLLSFLSPGSSCGPALVSLAFFVCAAFVFSICRKCPRPNGLVFGIPVAAGLCVMAAGAQFNLSIPINGLLLIWFGVGPIIFATSQQFIAGFIKGKKFSAGLALNHITSYLLSALLAYSALNSSPQSQMAQTYFSFFALVNIYIIGCHFLFTGLWRAFSSKPTPVTLGFAASSLWCLAANFVLLDSQFRADSSLHILALGWAVTLVITTSSNIISFMSLQPILKSGQLCALVLAWQLVVLFRAFPESASPYLPGGAWSFSFLMLLVLGSWAISMIGGIVKLIRARSTT